MSHFDFTVNNFLPEKGNKFYKYTTDAGCQEYRHITNYNELFIINSLFKKNEEPNKMNNYKIKIIIYARPLDMNCGGVVALHNLVKCINDTKNPEICAKLFIFNGLRYSNEFCEDFASIEEAGDDNVIVVYPEIIRGNPLNCKKVVRWILLELGKEMPVDNYKNWGKNDLVYYFNSEIKFEKNPEKIGCIYKLLTCLYMNPAVKQINFGPRAGVCYTIRKANEIHKDVVFQPQKKQQISYFFGASQNKNRFMINPNILRILHPFYGKNRKFRYPIPRFFQANRNYPIRNPNFVHPPGSFELTREHTILQHIYIFNKFKWFMCYDPSTFYIVIAALCGCIPIVRKISGLNKQQWLKTTAASEYLKNKGLDNLYGIAYGVEDMQYAENTIHLVREQWENIIHFNKENYIFSFVNDIQNFENMPNTVSTFYD